MADASYVDADTTDVASVPDAEAADIDTAAADVDTAGPDACKLVNVVNPGRAISGWRWGGLIMVCGGKVGGTLTERERSRDDQIAMGGSRRFTRLTKTSSKPGSWSSGCSLMNAITLR